MRRTLFRAIRWAVICGVITLFVVVSRDDLREEVLDAYILLLAALAALVLVRATSETVGPSGTSPFEAALEQSPRVAERPGPLVRLEREVALATETAFDLHFRLRPVLREVATHRLATRRGIGLDDDPKEARAILGDEAWELVRADLPPPADRLGPGRPLADLRATVAALERI